MNYYFDIANSPSGNKYLYTYLIDNPSKIVTFFSIIYLLNDPY